MTTVRTLYSLGSKSLRHNRGRAVLTALGIVLGVAIVFGVLVSSATTNAGVDRLFEDFTGRADVLVSPAGAFDATMPSVAMIGLRRLPDVEAAAPGYGFDSQAIRRDGEDLKATEMSLQGIVLEADRRIHNYDLVDGRFFEAGAPEVVLPQRLADQLGRTLGDSVELTTPAGPRTLTVTGILTDTGAARRNEGRVAFTSLPTAQDMGRVGDALSGAALILRDGVPVGDWIDAHEGDLGPGYRFIDASQLGAGFRDFLSVLQSFFTFFAAIALFVGAFLIYLTLSMAVVERTRTYGTMRALGCTRGQVVRVVLAEAAVLGVLSTLAGLALGLLAARGLLVLIGQVLQIELAGLKVPPGAVVAGATLGIGVTLASSIAPALRAGRLSPVVAMKGDYAHGTRLSRGWVAGILLVAFGLIVRTAGTVNAAVTGMSTLCLLFGSVLLVPALLGPLASLLGGATRRIAPGVGDIAVLHLVKERSRSAYTLGLIMVVMAMLLAIGGVNASVTRAISDVVDRQFGSDLQVSGPAALDPAIGDALLGVEGVEQVTPVTFGTTRLVDADEPEQRAFVTMVDPATYFDVAGFSWVEGNDAAARDALGRGREVLLTEALAKQLDVGVGDTVRIEAAAGIVAFTVAGTYVSFERPPTITVGIGDGREQFGANRPSVFLVSFSPEADHSAVQATIISEVVKPQGLTFRTAAGQKAAVTDEIGRYFRIVYAILLFAAVVGLLGLANTLAMSVLRRWREIGVLRAIGVTRTQVARMVLVESATMGLVAFALALPLGSLLSVLVVADTSQAFGLTMPYVYPAAWVPLLVAFGALVAILAAVAPGRRAARLEVVHALQFE